MSFISYEKISGLFRSMVEAIEYIKMSDEDIASMQTDWIHSSAANPRVRKMFSVLCLDDEMLQVECSLRNSFDEKYDIEFTTKLLAIGMVVAWLEPKVHSTSNIAQMFGGKEEKFYSQSSHLGELKGLLKDKKIELSAMIRDYGTYNNSYISGGE